MMNQYGLMSRKNENVYEFIAYEELLNPLARYRNQTAVTENDILEDWSSKFHSIEEQDSKIGAYARVNNFKYKYDNEGDSFADGFLPVADQTINDTKTLISRPYKAPDNSVNSINGIRLKNCNLYKKEFNDDGTLKSVKPLKSAPYYARVKQINTELTYNIAGATGVKKITRSTPFLTFDGLDYNSIIPSYYAAFGNMINYGEKLKIKVYLSVLDIHALNFFKLKYFKQLGALYYLSKSIKFVKNGITTIEVIRVKSIEQSGQFNNDFNKDFNK